MSFWREEDDDEIWKELLYWLENPVTAEENWQRNKEEKAYVEAIVDKMFSEKSSNHNVKEPYLKYEELFEPDSKTKLLEGKVVKEKQLNPFEKIDSRDDLTTEEKNKRKEKLSTILEEGKNREKEINKKSAIDNLKIGTGAVLETASLLPQTRGANIAVKGAELIGKKLAPKLGRKMAKEIGKGTVDGMVSGAMEGAGRGLLTDEDLLKTTLQDAAIGTVLGAGGGVVGANAQKAKRARELKSESDIKKLRKKETGFYKDYVQGTTINHPDIGKINFTQSGLETVSKNPNASRSLDKLKEDLKGSKYLGYELPYNDKHGNKDNIKGFYKLGNDKKDKEFLIADATDGAKYYLSKKKDDIGIRPSRVEPISSTPIINHDNTNFNPVEDNSIIPKLSSFKEWLEELKRKRRRF